MGGIPPPVEKKYLTKDHLILLTLIESLKAVYSLEEIKIVLGPILNNPEIFDDDIIKAMHTYNNYLTKRN